MRWQGGRESENIEDRRGMPPARVAAVGGGVGTVLFVVVALLLGADPKDLLRLVQNNPNVAAQQPAPQGAPGQGIDDEGKKFVKVVLAETEDVWTDLFQEMGKTYRKPTLVLFERPGQHRGLWLRQFRRRAVLLPGRLEGLPRPRLLR